MATLVTKEIDLHAFQAGIHISGADLISPVVIREEQNPHLVQTLTDIDPVVRRHLSLWGVYAGPAGVGQYSLITGRPAGVLARMNLYYRTPSEREMSVDFDRFGEQVMGPAVSEVSGELRERYKNAGVFQVFGEYFYFSGSARLDRSVYLSRVFPGTLPIDLSDIIRDIEGINQTGEMVRTQGYLMFHAVNGRISYAPLREIGDYDPSKLVPHGDLKMDEGKLLFNPTGTDQIIDFTRASFNR